MARNKRTQYDLMHPLFKAMKDNKLPGNQRLVLLGLFRFVDGNGVCYPSYNTLIEETGLSRPTISSTIKKLVSSGWITYEQGDKSKNLSNTYHLDLERLGFEVQVKTESKVVPIEGFIAPDGSRWSCPSDYWQSRQQTIN